MEQLPTINTGNSAMDTDSNNMNLIPSPISRSSSARSSRSNLSIDLSTIPPVPSPSPPSNTLIMTNLNDLEIFRPDHLLTLRNLISQTNPIASWSPLKSFRRIIVSFPTADDAQNIRDLLDGESMMGHRMRIYFGQHTPIDSERVDQHLAAPESKKLFFISPPPSPPHGWEMRNEEPPNSNVMAEDLAEALKKLSWNTKRMDEDGEMQDDDDVVDAVNGHAHNPSSSLAKNSKSAAGKRGRHNRSPSTIILEPENVEGGWDMPGISVEDYSDEDEMKAHVDDAGNKYVPVVPISSIHTARPPVETMQDV